MFILYIPDEMRGINFHVKSQKAPRADFEISLLFLLLLYDSALTFSCFSWFDAKQLIGPLYKNIFWPLNELAISGGQVSVTEQSGQRTRGGQLSRQGPGSNHVRENLNILYGSYGFLTFCHLNCHDFIWSFFFFFLNVFELFFFFVLLIYTCTL